MLEIILVQGFCQLKIIVTQFPNGFRLEISWQLGSDIETSFTVVITVFSS